MARSKTSSRKSKQRIRRPPVQTAAAKARPATRGPARRPSTPASLPSWLDPILALARMPATIAVVFGWLVVVLLYAAGVLHHGGLLAFLLATVAAGVFAVVQAVRLLPAADPLRAASKVVLVVLVGVVPVLFDASTADVFNLPKYTLCVVGGLVLAWIWIVRSAYLGNVPRVAGPIGWAMLALLAWTVVSTATSTAWRLSLLGQYGIYQGLYLMLALTLVAFCIYWSLRSSDVLRFASVAFFVGGGLVVLYGLLQVHDRLVGGSWDWIHWQIPSFAGDIWSTFGNPNHLGGYLATILPLGLIVLLRARSWAARIVTGVVIVAALLELIETASRGAWGAAFVSLVLFGALALRMERDRVRTGLIGAGALIAVIVAAGGLLSSSHYVRHKVDSAFRMSGNSTVAQRVELIKSAVKMADHSPIVGLGPDTFQLEFPKYQTAKFVHLYGPTQIANGPHDVFANYLAGEGYVGLLLWCLLLVAAGVVAVRAWRRFAEQASVDAERSRADRLLLAGVLCALVAYVLQASFDPLQVGLVFMSFVLFGLLAVLGRAAGVNEGLPLPARRAPAAQPPDPSEEDEEAYLLGQSSRSPARGGRRYGSRLQQQRHARQVAAASVVGILAAVGVGYLIVGSTAPYRADHDYHAFFVAEEALTKPGATLSATSEDAATTLLLQAIRANPWEPSYYEEQGQSSYNAAAKGIGGVTNEINELTQAYGAYERALQLAPGSAAALNGMAESDYALSVLKHDPSLHTAAIALEKQAIAADPLDPAYSAQLAKMK